MCACAFVCTGWQAKERAVQSNAKCTTELTAAREREARLQGKVSRLGEEKESELAALGDRQSMPFTCSSAHSHQMLLAAHTPIWPIHTLSK